LNNILVTGGAGFIGSHLVTRFVSEGDKVCVLDNLSSGSEENLPMGRIEFVKGDIRDDDLLDALVRKTDIVFHLAEFIPETEKFGPGHVIRYSVENPLLDFDVSCRGTLLLLDKCRQYDKRLVFTSTSAVYGAHNLVPIKEEFETLPVSPYGASKLCAETYLKLYSRLYGVPTTVVRLFNVFGPRQRKYVVYDTLLKLVVNQRKLEVLGTGEETRDFINVMDVVDALLLVANARTTYGGVFNVGTGRGTRIKDVIKLITSILGIDPEVKYASESWRGDIKTLIADTSRIRGLGFAPKCSMEDGLKEVIRWFHTEAGFRRLTHI